MSYVSDVEKLIPRVEADPDLPERVRGPLLDVLRWLDDDPLCHDGGFAYIDGVVDRLQVAWPADPV